MHVDPKDSLSLDPTLSTSSKTPDRMSSTPSTAAQDDNDPSRKRQKKKHLDQKQQELKSQIELSKEHELALKKLENTAKTAEFFSKSKPKTTQDDEFQRPLDILPHGGASRSSKTMDLTGHHHHKSHKKTLTLNIYSSGDLEKTKFDENYQR